MKVGIINGFSQPNRPKLWKIIARVDEIKLRFLDMDEH